MPRYHTTNRRALLAKVHIAKKQLALADDQYRAILEEQFNVSSAGKLKPAQLVRLVEHFHKLGWQQRPAGWFYNVPKETPHRQQKKYILSMWKALGYRAESVDKRVKQQFGVDKLLWLHDKRDLHVLITDLQARCARKGIDCEV